MNGTQESLITERVPDAALSQSDKQCKMKLMRKKPTITQVVAKLSEYNISDAEAALVRLILHIHGTWPIRNRAVQKIASRANKQVEQIEYFLLEQKADPTLELLGKFYELSVEGEDKKINGAYFTPPEIVSYIIEETVNGIGTICDPACGSGAFLVEAAKLLKRKTRLSYAEIFATYLYGVDILRSNIEHVRLILSLLAVISGEDQRELTFNLHVGDALVFCWKREALGFEGFDYVVGNPPYVRTKNLRVDVRENIKRWPTGNFANADLYIPFFELAANWTNSGGRIGYITPSTYLSSFNAKILRGFLSEKKYVEKIIDFNGLQIFEGATTYTCITILNKRSCNTVQFALIDSLDEIKTLRELNFREVKVTALNSEEWRLLSKKDAENILRIEQAGCPLDRYVARYVTGIATLHNSLFLIPDNGKPYLKKSYEGREYLIERGITRKIVKPNKIKDRAALQNNCERIIYPYRTLNGRARLIEEKDLRTHYPKAYEYLRAIKDELAKRDKGKREYKAWYAYGRTQGINDFGKKIISPMMGNKPSFVIVEDTDSLVYCGYAIYAKHEEDYQLLERILNSSVMWYYLEKTSKNYSGGFKSFAKNYIKNFSIPSFTVTERRILLRTRDREKIDRLLWKKYQLE
ncbi:SAM-dependent DNA methyltransferase [bacterium]|nr:SAM-dependent DNA methyltransferase [bacterium]